MKKQISKFSIAQTSKITALLYFFFGIPHAILGLCMLLFAEGTNRIAGIAFLFMPIIMCVIGYICIAIVSFIYNFLASKVGGIEFELTDIPESNGI